MTPTNDELSKIKETIDLLKKINHENVIQYLDFFVEPFGITNCPCLLTKYYKVNFRPLLIFKNFRINFNSL